MAVTNTRERRASERFGPPKFQGTPRQKEKAPDTWETEQRKAIKSVLDGTPPFQFSRVETPERFDFLSSELLERRRATTTAVRAGQPTPPSPVEDKSDIPANPDDYDNLQSVFHLRPVMHRRGLGKIIERMCDRITGSGIEFESIAFTGISGMMVGPAVAARLCKNVLVVRKVDSEKSHSSFEVEGLMCGGRYLFIDDLIDNGTTVRRVTSAVTKAQEKWRRNHPQNPLPNFKCVGIFLYNQICGSYTSYRCEPSYQGGDKYLAPVYQT